MDNHNITTSSPNLKVNVLDTLTIDGTVQKNVVDNKFGVFLEKEIIFVGKFS